jgi:hypothetical protein
MRLIFCKEATGPPIQEGLFPVSVIPRYRRLEIRQVDWNSLVRQTDYLSKWISIPMHSPMLQQSCWDLPRNESTLVTIGRCYRAAWPESFIDYI